MSADDSETELQALIDLAKEAALSNPESIDTAVDVVLAKAQKLPKFSDFTASLVRRAIREMVEDARCQANLAMRRANGGFSAPAKVVPGKATAELMRSHYLYLMAGKTLGKMTRDDLLAVADAEEEQVAVHSFHARLCRNLAAIVPEGKTVEQAVTEKKLDAMWDKSQKG